MFSGEHVLTDFMQSFSQQYFIGHSRLLIILSVSYFIIIVPYPIESEWMYYTEISSGSDKESAATCIFPAFIIK